jgi:ribosome-binding protein aMBF1 (putative translation factor)
MNKDILFKRILNNNCPICNKKVDKESVVVNYGKAKLKVCKKHIKYKEKRD